MPDRPLTYRKLLRILRRFEVREDKKCGKGSHRMLRKVVNGQVESYPVRCHNENDQLSRPIVQAIRRRFQLTADDGVSDGEFYSR